jgi:hypothetical protein
MTKDSPRTINDYYATVYLRRFHVASTFDFGDRIKVMVRIPEPVVTRISGTRRKPGTLTREIHRRTVNVARKTVPTTIPFATMLLSLVDTVMPPNLPKLSNFKAEDGAEGWILETSGVSGLLNLLSGPAEECNGGKPAAGVEIPPVQSSLEKGLDKAEGNLIPVSK